MANKDPSKTEKATPKKREEVRDDGDLAISQDVTSVIVITGALVLLKLTSPWITDGFVKLFDLVIAADPREKWTVSSIMNGTLTGVLLMSQTFLPTLLGIFALSFVSIRLQTGSYFSTKALKLKFDGLNPVNGFQQLMPNKDNMIKFFLTMSKVVVISILVYFLMRNDFRAMVEMPLFPAEVGSAWLINKCFILAMKILTIFIILAIIDIIWKRKQYEDKIMMTKDEVKDERKNMEGDPKVKAKIRQKMRDMVLNSIQKSVAGANVILTNPTHVAIALKYNPGDVAPTVVAKGLRKRALFIRKLAKKASVPIMEVPPLARALYRSTPVGGAIKREFFAAVAAILARLQNKQKKTTKPEINS